MSDQTSTLKPGNKRAMLVFIGCFCMCFGSVPIFLGSSAAFFAVVPMDLGLDMSGYALWLTAYAIASIVALPIMGNIFPKVKTKILLSILVVAAAVSFALFGLCTQLWQFIACGALLGMTGGAYGLYVAPVLIGNWFKKRTGFFLGLTTLAMGLSSAFTSTIFTLIINATSWQTAYFVGGVLICLFSLPWCLTVFAFQPSDVGYLPYGVESEAELASIDSEQGKVSLGGGVSVKAAVCSLAFVAALIGIGLTSFYGGYGTHWISFMGSLGYDAVLGSFMVTASQLGYLLSSLVVGPICDKFGGLAGMIVTGACTIIGGIILATCTATAALFVGAFIFGVNSSWVTIAGPQFVRDLFGNKNYSKIFSYVMMATQLVGGFGATVIAMVLTASGGYTATWILAVVIAIVIIALSVVAKASSKKLKWED